MPRKRRLGLRVNATGRSEERRQFAALTYELLQSPAWRSLSGPAVKIFLELRSRFNGGNNGKLTLSLDEAARILFLGKATVLRGLNELKNHGLIVCTRRGHWYGRMASTWAVTDREVDGAPPANTWRRWRPPDWVLQRTIKTKIGSLAVHDGALRVRDETEASNEGSPTEPVRAK